MEGLRTFNAKLETDGKPKLFCLPPKMEVTTQQAAEIMPGGYKQATHRAPAKRETLNSLDAVEPAEQQPRQGIHRKHVNGNELEAAEATFGERFEMAWRPNPQRQAYGRQLRRKPQH
jgi:hypothetical protein